MPLPLPFAVRNVGAAVADTAVEQPKFVAPVVAAVVGLAVGLVVVGSDADHAAC